MQNKLANLIFWLLVVILFSALVTKLGWPLALLISFSIALLIPQGALEILIGFIGLSLNMTLLAYALKFWPITLIMCLWALLIYLNEKSTNDTDPVTNVNDIPKLENKSGDIQ